MLLQLSRARCPLEFHLVAAQDLIPWRHPAPLQFHYSQAWRAPFTAALAHPDWHPAMDQPRTDDDLAAHVTVARARGFALGGPPPAALLPPVPSRDYPLACLSTGQILSKDEATSWALRHLPEPSRPVVRQVLKERAAFSLRSS